jgi:hypothetical protein
MSAATETWICPACGQVTDEPAWLGLANPASPALCPACPVVVELAVNDPDWPVGEQNG